MKYIIRFYNYYFCKERILARKLHSVIGFVPLNISIFKTAFCHKSITRDSSFESSNERLEYLGDAILSTIVAEYLFKKYPSKDEGFLTQMRSKIVKRTTLNKIANEMGLDVILSNYIQGRMSRSMLGNALEALLGAIYLEFGYKKTKDYVIKKILRRYLDIHELETINDNYKSKLLEWCQKENKEVNFEVVSRYKFEKRDRFKVAVKIDGHQIALADDFNKKAAEQAASRQTIDIMKIGTPA